MKAVIKYYMVGEKEPFIKYVDDLKFMGLIDVASDCPFDPDYLDRFYISANFNEEDNENEN